MVGVKRSTFRSKTKDNPFEKFANSKKKHEVVNRRVKGEDRNVGRARGQAVAIRKNKLVAEINSSKKSNTFSDRRFGENNASLSLEEKMFLRFQQERVKKAKQSKFNLDTAEAPILTHKGQILGSSSLNDEWAESSDDENLGKDVVNQLHFGGGLVPTHRASDSVQIKSRGDALQDIVMKSKLYKLEKKEAKNAQEDQRELLDKAYTDLVQTASLEFKPTRRDRSEGGPEDADEYDKSLRVMAFESRVQPSDRTKTREEIALSEYQKLAALEQERLKRMKPNYEEAGNEKKRKFPTNDDCIEDFDTELYDEPSVDSEEFDSEDEDSEADSDDDGEEGDDDEDDDGEDDDQSKVFSEAEEHPDPSLTSSNLSMPHSIECPQLLDDFKKLVNLYAGDAGSFSVLLERILTWNSIHLPGAKVENEKKMTIFFDILVNYFIFRGDLLPSSSREDEVLSVLEHLSSAIFRIATDLPAVSQSCFIKKLQLLQEKLTNELQFHADGRQSSCWLSLGSILFFQLLGGMQSLTDFRHCVVQPTQLLIAQSLVQCPISCLSDLSSGIILSSILSDYSSKTHETIPELLIFLQRAYDFLLSSNQELRFDFKADMSLPWKVFLPSSALVDHYPSIVNSLLTLTDSSIQNYQPESLVGINIRLEKLISLNIRESVFKPFQLLWAKHSEHLRLTPMPLRKSLFWRPSKKVVEEMLTPDYEVDYKMKTATPGVNPEKMKLKVLNKQLKREQKASMRELRRDSEFLDQEYFTEKSKTLSENKAERFRNYSWLEQEQATLNQQVRKSDKDPIKGGGSGGVPKKQRRR